MLTPIDQIKRSNTSKQPRLVPIDKLKPLPQKQVVQPKKTFDRPQVDPKILEEGRRANEYLKLPWYKKPFTKEWLRGVPQAAADTLVGTPAKLVTSAAESPYNIATGKPTNRTYKLPGLSPFQSYQTEFAKTQNEVIEGRQPLRKALTPFVTVPLAGLETAGIAKGLTAAVKTRSVLPAIDAIFPTNVSKQPVKYQPALASQKAEQVMEPVKAIKGKQRGFIKSIDASPETSLALNDRILGHKDSFYTPQNRTQATVKAQQLIFNNPSEAERIALGGADSDAVILSNELIKKYDQAAQKARQAGDLASFNSAMDKAAEISLVNAKRGTQLGQAVEAFKGIGELSPEGVLKVINKSIQDAGIPNFKLDNEKTFDFIRRAEEIGKIVDPKQKALAVMDLADDIYSNIPKTAQDRVFEVLNLPRAMMATADLSAPLRQGIFTAARHPVMFAKNFGKMFKYAFSEKAYRNSVADILTSQNYNLYQKHKLPLTDISAGLTGREEAFMSSLAEKIPIFGRVAKGSNRAYTGFLNKMRTDLFDDFVETAKLNGIKDQKYFDDAARFVGAATGRGNIAKIFGGNESGKVWNSFFFSPRLMASRMSLINPVYYVKLHPTVRKEALKSLIAFVGTGTGMLGLAKLNGAEVGTDPRSADFGKIKIGNTRYDTWGGFQQYARFLGQFLTNEKISTVTGKQSQLGSGFGVPNRKTITYDFLESKENPILSLVTRWMEGEKYGQPFNAPVEVINRFIPMIAQDAYDLYKERGVSGLGMALPAPFGVGVQTYGQQIPMLDVTESNSPTIRWQERPGMGEDIYNAISGNEFTSIPQDQWQPLYEEKQQETLRQIEVDAAKAEVLETGKSKQVGDTLVYLEDGIIKVKKLSKGSRTPSKDRLLYEEIQKRKTQPFYETR